MAKVKWLQLQRHRKYGTEKSVMRKYVFEWITRAETGRKKDGDRVSIELKRWKLFKIKYRLTHFKHFCALNFNCITFKFITFMHVFFSGRLFGYTLSPSYSLYINTLNFASNRVLWKEHPTQNIIREFNSFKKKYIIFSSTSEIAWKIGE